jgi:hypothetical protein
MAEVIQHRSSFIAETSYDRATGYLEIEFTDGKRFMYRDVPQGAYISLRSSSSIGKAFHSGIKNRFTGEEM